MSCETVLDALDPLLVQNHGPVFEASLFSSLLALPKVVRSFEFGAADGCIDCSPGWPGFHEPEGDAHRELRRRAVEDPRGIKLVYFDVKSTTARVGSRQLLVPNRPGRPIGQVDGRMVIHPPQIEPRRGSGGVRVLRRWSGYGLASSRAQIT
ncbi:hypothetical protein K491DRAFT_303693 [Lophiostoma macrostomum CBS 122681]|uniref:Uncharacterized protein n=1 Tax=Lophiostoma macrostomum CBS 122681 TaxID=1314788 RepID=A0A6A6TF08_9PLEO|nr:hypothetical protein K491DRAFT_303693 [Lophiostoma macrostomum CBS 122681]